MNRYGLIVCVCVFVLPGPQCCVWETPESSDWQTRPGEDLSADWASSGHSWPGPHPEQGRAGGCGQWDGHTRGPPPLAGGRRRYNQNHIFFRVLNTRGHVSSVLLFVVISNPEGARILSTAVVFRKLFQFHNAVIMSHICHSQLLLWDLPLSLFLILHNSKFGNN